MRTIKLCALSTQRPTNLLEAIRRSVAEIERSGGRRRPLPALHPTTAPD